MNELQIVAAVFWLAGFVVGVAFGASVAKRLAAFFANRPVH